MTIRGVITGVVRPLVIATLSKGGGAWILATRFWRDLGVWQDTAAWRD